MTPDTRGRINRLALPSPSREGRASSATRSTEGRHSGERLSRIVLQVTTSPEPAAQATLGSLAYSELFGMWRERNDIRDSSEFAAKLRINGWKRFGE